MLVTERLIIRNFRTDDWHNLQEMSVNYQEIEYGQSLTMPLSYWVPRAGSYRTVIGKSRTKRGNHKWK
jgi:hypothetical protein